MRKAWTVLAVAILVAGIAVGYLLGRRGQPDHAASPSRDVADVPITPALPTEPPERPPVADETHADKPAVASREETTSGHTKDVETAHVGDSRPAMSAGASPIPTPTPVPPPAPSVAPDQVVTPGAQVTQAPSASTLPPTAPPAAKPQTVDDPESDRHPPVLQSLRFDPPEIQNGGSATLTLAATDDLSGVKSIVGTVRGPSETAFVPFVGRDAGGNGVFTATIALSSQAEAGYWYVGSLQLVDKADNPVSVSFTKATVPAGGALHVVSEDSDSQAPEVRRIFIEKGTVSGGEKNRITIDIDDDRSGVASVTGMFQSPSKSAYISFACAASGEGSWAGDVLVPTNADCGAWTLWQLRVADKANNRSVLAANSPQLDRMTFVVSGGGACDSEPPVLDTLFVSPERVSNSTASEVLLTITAHDDAGTVRALTGRIEGPTASSGRPPTIFFSAPPGFKATEGPIVIRIAVPQHAAQGIWRVALLEITDDARNTRSYHFNDPALANANFEVE